MATAVLMPKLGLTMTEGTIDGWSVKEGEPVKKGDLLYTCLLYTSPSPRDCS